jgi:integrase
MRFDQGLKHAKGQSFRHQRNQEQCGDRFLVWLKKHDKNIQYADQLKPSTVVRFVDDEIERKIATSTIKLTLNVIRLAYNRLNLLYPDTYQAFTIKHPRLVGKVHKPVYLERTELEELLQHSTPGAVAAILLCGFCGLRLTEAALLRLADVDPVNNTVATGRKTNYSWRVIPVPEWVMERLLDCVNPGNTAKRVNYAALAAAGDDGQADLLPDDPNTYICPVSSDPMKPENKIAKNIRLSMAACDADRRDAWQKRVAAWEAAGSRGRKPEADWFPRISPHNLRATFGNMCVTADVLPEAQRCYMGHRPKDVLEMHYNDRQRVDRHKIHVVDKLEAYFKAPAANVQDIGIANCEIYDNRISGDSLQEKIS